MSFGKRSIVLLALVRASLAQDPPAPPSPAPLDLPAIAKLLEGDGKLPAVLSVLSSDVLDQVRESGGALTDVECDALLELGRVDEATAIASVRALAGSEAVRGTRLGLAREIRGCFSLGRVATDFGMNQRLVAGRSVSSWQEAAPLAKRRGGMLTARFVREYPEAPEVGHLLLLAANEAGKDKAPEVRAYALRLLGVDATVGERLERVYDLRKVGALPEVEAAIAEAGHAGTARTLDARAKDAADLAAAARRLAAAREWQAAAREPGIAGRVAKLRFLQAIDTDAAVEEARKMIADGVEHALPSIVLAAAAWFDNHGDVAVTHLDRARGLPGAAPDLAATVMMIDLTRKARLPPEEAKLALEAIWRECDAIVKDDPTEPAVLWRGLRSLGLGLGAGPEMLANTSAIVDLTRGMPDSLSARNLLFAGAATSDAEAGFAAIGQSVPASIAWSLNLLRLRATIAVELAVLDDGNSHAQVVEATLHDLEQAQQDPRDACYLRGLLEWSRCVRSGAAPEHYAAAHEQFSSAQRMAFERGAWPAAVALFASCVATNTKVDRRELDRVQSIALDRGDEAWLVPTAVLLLDRNPTTLMVEGAEGLLSKLRSSPMVAAARRALLAALAAAHVARGDAAAARNAAKQALATQVLPRDLQLLERGFLSLSEFRWNWGVWLHRTDFTITMRLDLLPIPALPSRERLEELARD